MESIRDVAVLNKLRVGVLFGGRSGKHEVSNVSATSLMNALDPAKYEIIPIGITKSGQWIAGKDTLQARKEEISGAAPKFLANM
jgi:D-alanine-D-alanine ligase